MNADRLLIGGTGGAFNGSMLNESALDVNNNKKPGTETDAQV